MTCFFTSRALRKFKKLPTDAQRRIIKKMDWYCAQQNPIHFAEPLIGKDIGEYRFRVGTYRVVCDIESDKVVILTVGHRKNIYR